MEINLQYYHHRQLRFVSELEALLGVDAAQPRLALSIQERLASKAVLKAFLKFDKLHSESVLDPGFYVWWLARKTFGLALETVLHDSCR